MNPSLLKYLSLFGIPFFLAGCLQTPGTMPVTKTGPETLKISDISDPWSASALVTPTGETLIALVSHRESFLDIWQLTADKKLVHIARDSSTDYHPDAVRWASPTELFVAAEGTSKIQRWKYVDHKLQLMQNIPVKYPPIALALGDLDKDGLLDIVSGPYAGNTLTILWGQPDGQFRHEHLDGDRVPQYPRIIDWDGDGRPDIVWSEYDAGSIRYAHGKGQRAFDLSMLQKPGTGMTRQLDVGDLDNDGFPDLVVALETGKAARILFNDGKGGIRESVEIPAPQYGYSATAIGYDHGKPILALSENGRIVLARPRDGNPHGFWDRRGLDAGDLPLDLQFIDLDRDGHLDLVIANSVGTTVQLVFGPLWENAKPIP